MLACQNRPNMKDDKMIFFRNTQKYNELQKKFSIDIESANSIYTKWYMKKFNINEDKKVKGSHDLIINDAYFYCYNNDKKSNGIPLRGVTINGFNGEIKEINLGVRVVKTNTGYKELKID